MRRFTTTQAELIVLKLKYTWQTTRKRDSFLCLQKDRITKKKPVTKINFTLLCMSKSMDKRNRFKIDEAAI